MTDLARLHDEVESKIELLLAEVSNAFTKDEQREVLEFLKAREYALALETFSAILVEEKKLVPPSILQRIDDISHLMGLGDEEFMAEVHHYYGQQRAELN